MNDNDSIPAKTRCDKIRWLENLWKRWIQVKKKEHPKFFWDESLTQYFREDY